jgi:hypothetical protein
MLFSLAAGIVSQTENSDAIHESELKQINSSCLLPLTE